MHSSTRPPNSAESASCSAGMRVEPPTSTTSLTVSTVVPASRRTDFTVSMQRANKEPQSFSNTGRVRVAEKLEPSAMASSSMSVSCTVDRVRLAASTALRSLCWDR